MVRRLILASAFALFFLLCWLPPLLLLAAAFQGGGEAGGGWLELLHLDERQIGLLRNTLVIGVGTALAASLIGVPLGWLLARTDLPFKGLFTLLAVAPVIVPPYVMGIACTELVADLQRSFGDALPIPRIRGLPGAIFLLTASLYPIAVLLAMKGFGSVDGDAEDAAELARGRGRAFFGVTLRLAFPALCAGALFVFVFAVADFSVPDFLSFTNPADEIPHVYATEIYSQFQRLHDPGEAAVYSLPLVALVGIAAWLLLRLEGRGDFVMPGSGLASPRRRALGGFAAPALLFATVVVGVTLLLPLFQLLRWMLRVVPGRPFEPLAPLRLAFEQTGGDIGRSLLASSSAGVAMALLGFLLAYAITRGASRRRSRALAALALLPLAFPALTLAIGEIRFWNHPANPLADAVYPSLALVVLTYTARFLPFAVLTLRSTLRGIDPAQEDAARLAGRGFVPMLLRVTLPAAAGGLATAAIVGFMLSMRELDSVTVLPAGSDVLPNRIYSMVHTARDAQVAALCLVLLAASAVPLLVYRLVLGKRLAPI